MDFTEKKLEIAIFALIAVMVAGFGSLFKSSGAAKLIGQDVVYEMPRPKTFVGSDFDLSDRDIDRQYKNPFDKKKKDDAARTVNAQGAQPAAKADDKKKQAAKKTDDKKKPKVDINVVGGPDKRMSDDGGLSLSQNYGQQSVNSYVSGDTSTSTKTQEDKEKLSPAQWRALIASEPTQANVSKLIKAYSAGEVDETTYLTVVGDLFASSKTENQALGIYAVNYIYTAKAFAMVTTTMEKLDSTNKAQAEGYLMAYTKGTRLNFLASALKSQNATVVAKAADVVLAGYEQAKSTPTDPSTGNGNTGSSTAVAAYAKFVPIFQSLATSSDATIVQLANSALGQMQTTVASI